MPGLNNAPVSIDLGGAEIVAWVPGAEVAAVCGGDDTIRFVAYDAAFKNPEVVLEAVFEGSIQSVTAHGSYVAVAESLSKTETGLVRVYRYTAENTLEPVFSQEVGYLPDSVAWSADGQTIVVANEGEPNDYYGTRKGIDPQGSISILRVDPDQGAALISAETLDFAGFSADELEAAGVRLSGMNAANPSRDLEPEFVRITPDSQQAVVTLQENNAMVVVDLASGTLGQPIGLGAKDWSGLSVDTSDDDGGISPVKGISRACICRTGWMSGRGRTGRPMSRWPMKVTGACVRMMSISKRNRMATSSWSEPVVPPSLRAVVLMQSLNLRIP